MAFNPTNPYDVDAHIAEAYDLCVTETNDLELLRRLIGARALEKSMRRDRGFFDESSKEGLEHGGNPIVQWAGQPGVT